MRSNAASFAVLVIFFALFSGCADKAADTAGDGGKDNAALTAEQSAAERSSAQSAAAMQSRAAAIAASLDDRQLAAQVMMTGIDGRGVPGRDMRILLDECPAGGIILFRYNLDTGADEIRSLIDGCAAIIKSGTAAEAPAAIRDGIPPLVAVDHEGGTVNRFNPGVASLPAASSYWRRLEVEGLARDETLGQVEADAFRAGAEIKGFGINMNLAPVAEYLTGDNRGFLEDRSYGPDPAFTAAAAAAFIRGMGRAGILCAVKHFPGSAGSDPHRFSSALSGDKASLNALTSSFAELIRGGDVRALMAAHTLVPALDSARIASLSSAVMKNWLRGELKFGGIIIADDFSMAAAGSHLRTETAAVQALAAGADMALVWPPDIRKTHRAIQAALADGTLPRERLREAAARIICEKLRMELLHDE